MADEKAETTSEIPSNVMIWSEEQAEIKQIEQIGISACGATAALNVLSALGITVDAVNVVEAVRTRLRDLEAPLPQYLLSRSVAGTTHVDIIDGIKKLTKNEVNGKFFHFFPERDIDISLWLKKWIMHGGVPVVTLNCQKLRYPDGTIPDAWHHQMIYGVSDTGVHMTNPYQVLMKEQLLTQLWSESVLLIHRNDVIMRWDVNMDVAPLQNDSKWNELQVVEQIDKLVKEETLLLMYGSELKYRELVMSHITIPAAYKAGITIFAKTDSKANVLLQSTPDLPIKDTDGIVQAVSTPIRGESQDLQHDTINT